MKVVLGTRGSALARWQASFVAQRLEQAGYRVDIRIFSTTGDRMQDRPLVAIGGKGLFTQELDEALLREEIDLAVHSLKDLPTELPEGLALVAVPERDSPFDVLVFREGLAPCTVHELPMGARVGTSSLRRGAQLRALRPDLKIVPVRGNVDTRLRKLDASNWHALVLAEAGLRRLNIQRSGIIRLSAEEMVPAVSQGALGVVCKASRRSVCDVLREVVHHEPSGIAVRAERAFLRRLEGGCQVPVGALATLDDAGVLRLLGTVVALDGSEQFREQRVGSAREPESLGTLLAEHLLALGAHRILKTIRSA